MQGRVYRVWGCGSWCCDGLALGAHSLRLEAQCTQCMVFGIYRDGSEARLLRLLHVMRYRCCSPYIHIAVMLTPVAPPPTYKRGSPYDEEASK